MNSKHPAYAVKFLSVVVGDNTIGHAPVGYTSVKLGGGKRDCQPYVYKLPIPPVPGDWTPRKMVEMCRAGYHAYPVLTALSSSSHGGTSWRLRSSSMMLCIVEMSGALHYEQHKLASSSLRIIRVLTDDERLMSASLPELPELAHVLRVLPVLNMPGMIVAAGVWLKEDGTPTTMPLSRYNTSDRFDVQFRANTIMRQYQRSKW